MMIIRLFLLILFIPILAFVLRRIGKTFQVRPIPSEPLKTVRDPICQTFLDPSSPLVLSETEENSNGRVYFCSVQCQSKYHLLHEKPS
ncbi:MAG: hypothetical protein M1532_04470 [Nitrospirae bacterium]|nr:hypothetical protein [Nitrospirota bacterium]